MSLNPTTQNLTSTQAPVLETAATNKQTKFTWLAGNQNVNWDSNKFTQGLAKVATLAVNIAAFVADLFRGAAHLANQAISYLTTKKVEVVSEETTMIPKKIQLVPEEQEDFESDRGDLEFIETVRVAQEDIKPVPAAQGSKLVLVLTASAVLVTFAALGYYGVFSGYQNNEAAIESCTAATNTTINASFTIPGNASFTMPGKA
jgi:hypothetical protein